MNHLLSYLQSSFIVTDVEVLQVMQGIPFNRGELCDGQVNKNVNSARQEQTYHLNFF